MRLYMAGLGLLIVVAVVLASIFVVVPVVTDDDDTDAAVITLPGVLVSSASTDEVGAVFFDGEGGEEIEVLVHRADGTTWDNVTVYYLDGDGYDLFVAEDPLGRFLPSWAFFTQAIVVDLTTRVEGMIEILPDTDQFNAMLLWFEDVKANVDVRRCEPEQQLMDEAGVRVALTTSSLSPLSSVAVGLGTSRNTIRFLERTIPREPSEVFFNVFEFQLEDITTAFRHYEALSEEECQLEGDVSDTPVPSETLPPSQPTPTSLPESPTDTPAPGLPANTPDPRPIDTSAPDQPTDTPVPGPTNTPTPQPSDTPRPTPASIPVQAEFIRITDIQPALGTTIAENAIISVTVEFRVSSLAGVSISGLADMDANLLSLGIHSLAATQGTLKLQAEQFNASGGRLCTVSVTMEGPSEQLASDARGFATPVC